MHEGFFPEPPRALPGEGTAVDAPLLGNGDMLAAFGAYPGCPQFWVTTNDFWELTTASWYPRTYSVGPGRPLPLGRLVFDIPGLRGGAATVRQDYATGTTRADFTPSLTLTAFVSATENVLVCEFSGAREPLTIEPVFLFPAQRGYGVEKAGEYRRFWSKAYVHNAPVEYSEGTERVIHGYRQIAGRADQETTLAYAGCFLPGAEGPGITLAPGETRRFVLVLRSAEKTILPEKVARVRAERFTGEDAALLGELHRAWWRRYWAVSEVTIEDPEIEARYYLSMYVLGSLSRDRNFPPCIFGLSTWDAPAWNGNYKINYNHQAPYWGLYAAGRYEQADPHDAPYLALEAQARDISRELTGHGGILMPGGLGPKGLVSESMIYHMKSMGAFAVTNMAMRWYTTYDEGYGLRIYSYLRGIVDFWEADLVFEDGFYHVVNDHAHEMWTDIDTRDTPSTLGFIRCALRLILDVSAVLGIDEDKRGRWRELLEGLAPYPRGNAAEITRLWDVPGNLRLTDVYPREFLEGREIFLLHGKGEEYSFRCGVFLQQVFSAGEIGLGSDPALLQAARNSLELRVAHEERFDEWGIGDIRDKDGNRVFQRAGAWNDGNHSCMFFPIAVRIGYDPEEVWGALKTFVRERGLPNGYVRDNPHGVENLSTVPNTVQEMMLLSHEGVLRFFRGWPRGSQPNAAFRDLRAYGAFRVSARLEAGAVTGVTVTSEKGRECAVEVFAPRELRVTDEGRPVPVRREGAVLRFPTTAGHTYLVG